MIEAQSKQLKLNAERINRILIQGNKNMKKLRAEERTLFKIQENKRKIKEREDIVEGRSSRGGFASNAIQKAAAPALGFIDRLKDFFLLIGAGILINSLPAIISRIEKFLKDNKDIIENIKFIMGEIGKLYGMFKGIVTDLPKATQETWEKSMKEITDFLDFAKTEEKNVNSEINDLTDLETELAKQQAQKSNQLGSLPQNPTPVSRKNMPINFQTKKPVTVDEFNTAAAQVETLVQDPSTQQGQPITIFLPGVGSVSGSPGLIPFTYNITYTDPSGASLSRDEFFSNARSVERKVKGYSKGGTVAYSTSGKQNTLTIKDSPIKSPYSIESFSTFQNNSILESTNLIEKSNSNDVLEELVDNITKLFNFKIEDTPPGQPTGGSRSRPSSGAGPSLSSIRLPGNGKIIGGAIVTQRNDPDKEQTGIDIAVKDLNGGYGIGAPIQNPFQGFRITATGFHGQGSGPTGRGYGNWITGETLIDGKRYELLIGHLDKVAVSKGQVLSAGELLGTQGITGRAMGPHVTTHINQLDGGNAQSILDAVEDSWVNGTIIKSDAGGSSFKIQVNKLKPVSMNNLLNRANALEMQSSEDVSSAALVVFVRQPTIIAT